MKTLSFEIALLTAILLLILLPLAVWIALSLAQRPAGAPGTGGDMAEQTRSLFDKAARLIDTSGPQHKDAVVRWLSLLNWQANQLPWSGELWGASQGIRHRFEQKFGPFCPKTEAVARVDRDA